MLKLLKSDEDANSEDRSSLSAGSADELRPLLGAVLRGDAVATRTFLASLLPAMLRAVRRVLGSDHPDVEDVTQEAAVGVLRALPGFRQDCTITHFACRIAVLTSLAARRRSKLDPSIIHAAEPDFVEHAASEMPGPAHALASSRRRAILYDLLDRLPEAQAEALVLHCVLGYSIDEISRMTTVPTNTARSRVRLAKDALRRRVTGDPQLNELLRDES